jgi:transmembrane sensor
MQELEKLHTLIMAGTASEEEVMEWRNLLKMPENKQKAVDIFKDIYSLPPVNDIDAEETREILRQIISIKNIENNTITGHPIAHRVHFLKTAWFRYAAAIIILIGVGTFVWFTTDNNTGIKQSVKQAINTPNIPPGSNKALLTLSDGKVIELNKTSSQIITDHTLSIENNSGQLIYKKGELAVSNTMTTPKGGQYQLTLSDGSKVWLNAASSITFPTSFTANTREVSITGEAYFEIARDAKRPFQVKIAGNVVDVLGTSFNINAYTDEPVTKISLVSGAIKISNQVLKPGEALVNNTITKSDIARDIAWKNNIFSFHAADLSTVLRQLSRWYNIEVKYEGKGSEEKITGKIPRSLPLSAVLDILKDFHVNYRMEKQTMIVL